MKKTFPEHKLIDQVCKLPRLLVVTLLIGLFFCWIGKANAAEINPEQFGAVGDGAANDTTAIQAMLTQCSNNGDTCRITNGKSYLITSPLYMWGGANLQGDGGELKLNVSNTYVIRVGISGVNVVQNAFSGTIHNVNFRVVGGTSGRILFFFRTSGAHITNNHFDIGTFAYAATSSGNDNAVLSGAGNYIRQNITIEGNTVTANAINVGGNEGIGIADFDGVVIKDNYVYGVGDDPIGVHYSQNIEVSNNKLQSVDGRIFISNPVGAVIKNNIAKRIPSPQNGVDYTGIALIYIGFENLGATNSLHAPTNVNVFNNTLIYSATSIDSGSAIYVYAPRNVAVKNNQIINDSPTVTAKGIYIIPADFAGGANWTDPDGLDVGGVNGYARVYGVSAVKNVSTGLHPQGIIQTGMAAKYDTAGSIISIDSNQFSNYSFYTSNVQQTNNVTMATAVDDFAAIDGNLDLLTDHESPYIDSGTNTGISSDYADNPIYGTPDIGAYEYQPPHAMGTNKIDVGAGARVYGDGKFRDLDIASSVTADLNVTPASGSFPTFSATDVRPDWMDISDIVWDNTGNHHKTWTESSNTLGATNTFHTIGDLEANKNYNVQIDGASAVSNVTGANCSNIAGTEVCKAGSNGKITFTYTGGYSTHTFDVTEGDNTAPTITITNPGATSAQSKTITASATESATLAYHTNDSGIDTCDGSLSFTAYSSITFSNESDNGKKVCYRATDATNNIAYSLSDAIAGIDTQVPIIFSASPNNQTFPVTTATTALSAVTDESATCKYAATPGIDFASMITFDSTNSTNHSTLVAGLNPGATYSYFVKCQDSATNVSSEQQITFSIAPVSAQTTALEKVTVKVGRQINKFKDTIRLTVSKFKLKSHDQNLANGQVKIYKNNKLWKTVSADASGAWSKTLKLANDTSKKIKLFFYDSFGSLLGTKKATVKVDTEKPKLTLAPVFVKHRGGAITWQASDNKGISHYDVKLKGISQKTDNQAYIIPSNAQKGIQTLTVTAVDKAGNKTSKSALLTVTW